MSGYRRGAVFGLTVAEMFILLTFLLLIALLGLIQTDEMLLQADTSSTPRIWVRPEKIHTLVNAAEEAHRAYEKAVLARSFAEKERDKAYAQVEKARKAQAEAEQVRAAIKIERDRAHEKLDATQKALKESELARATTARERDYAQRDLELLRHKGENPPCWYKIVNSDGGKTRERRLYVFKVAVYEDSIELSQLAPPPGGAFDDGGKTYVDEWKQLLIGELPYGKKLSDNEFEEAVKVLYGQGKKRQVRTYECLFSVMVWDKTPDDAKERWQYAHELIERYFNAYTVKDLNWDDVN